MFKVTLKDISEVVSEYASLLANILKIDVEIVDCNMERIAGTGIYENRIGENIELSGYVYKSVLKTGKSKVLENPGEDDLCKCCKDRGSCKEHMEICVPIKYGNDTFGIIGLVCSSKEQKIHLTNNLTTNLKFLEQISDFIAIKIIEKNEVLVNENNLKFLDEVINSLDDGVMTLDGNKTVQLINNKALKILNLTPEIIGKTIIIQDTDDYFPGGEIYNIKLGNEEYKVIGKMVHNYINYESCEKIFIFNGIKTVREEVVNLTHGNNKITCDEIIGESLNMVQLKKKIKKIAYSKSTVLVTGESGTGKELVARAIHAEGSRKNKPFIAINCGAIPESLLESELFGYAKGAFSGANSNGRVGKFELANKGVIFLDEIGDMPLYLQVKLLRVLQERTIVKIGSNKLINLDIRVVAATNKNLKKLVEEGKFREDLYYRLNVIPIDIPPLRKREGDIELLINSLIKKYNILFNKYVHTIDKKAIKVLKEYPWPGNIRELQNAAEFMVSLSGENGVITKEMLPKAILEYKKQVKEENSNELKTLKQLEYEHIKRALDICGRDTAGKKEAAKMLGIGIATLYRKLDEKH